MSPRSQWSAVIQTQGATNERSPGIWMRLIFCKQSVECSRAKGPSGPFCALWPSQPKLTQNAGPVRMLGEARDGPIDDTAPDGLVTGVM